MALYRFYLYPPHELEDVQHALAPLRGLQCKFIDAGTMGRALDVVASDDMSEDDVMAVLNIAVARLGISATTGPA